MTFLCDFFFKYSDKNNFSHINADVDVHIPGKKVSNPITYEHHHDPGKLRFKTVEVKDDEVNRDQFGNCECGNFPVIETSIESVMDDVSEMRHKRWTLDGYERSLEDSIKDERITSNVSRSLKSTNRPWMVRFKITTNSGLVKQCGGALLNKIHVVSVAHCFCGIFIKCTYNLKGKVKIAKDDQKAWIFNQFKP